MMDFVRHRGVQMTALCLGAGIAVGTILWKFAFRENVLRLYLPLSVLLTLWTFLVLGASWGKLRASRQPLCAGLLVVSGLLCCLSGRLNREISGLSRHPVSNFAMSCADRVEGKIDSLGFREKDVTSLVKALVLGRREGLAKKTRQDFRNAGASHILALSGMHLGIIFTIFSFILNLFAGNSPPMRYVKGCLIILCIGFYTIMTGASPSICRAFLFIFLSTIDTMLERTPDIAYNLFVALIVQASLNASVVNDVGFILSYLAVSGIIFLCKPLTNLWQGGFPIMKKLWEVCCVSISAQAFCCPVVWLVFGSFPLCFLLTNLISMPLVSIIMFASIACISLCCIGICPEFLVRLTEWVCLRFLDSISIIAGI